LLGGGKVIELHPLRARGMSIRDLRLVPKG